ncbi:hypothetical protein [uncultured Acetobacteroides sp.]|uniref:hypothetical protein n=1 Tax=uncultured Acetobacteroides sp. TaxID=1760811 RepID=UPI0029F52026|nr:hypothetical protein [uncultured Acetobacteroides sp.]
MSNNDSNKSSLTKLRWFLIGMGLLEIVTIRCLFSGMIGIAVGLSTLIPAYISLNEKRTSWSYALGIWGIIKYCPLVWLGMVAFILGDMHSAREKGVEIMNNSLYRITVGYEFLFVLLVAISFAFSIIILSKTSKQVKLGKA